MRNAIIVTVLLAALPALAEPPVVVASIRPVHDLVAAVMAGAGEPVLLLRDRESVHHAALRPSQLRVLAEAGVIVWNGENLEPWLAKGLELAGPAARKLELASIVGLTRLDIRNPATVASEEEQVLAALEQPEDIHIEEDADFLELEENFTESDLEAAALEAEAAELDAAEAAQSEAAVAEVTEAGHDHGDGSGHDPHLWLDPANSALMLTAISRVLAEADPENAETYLANAEEARLALAEAVLEAKDQLAALTDTRFIFNHDSFQYFEHAFRLKSLGATSTTDAQKIGAKSVADIEAGLEFAPTACVVIDSSESARSVRALFPQLKTVVADPFGFRLDREAPYPAALFKSLAATFAECG